MVASGNGNGTFTLFGSFPIGAGQQGLNMVVGDFNGDGFPDLAVYECGLPTRSIEILLQGAGGTKTFAITSLLPVGPILFGCASGTGFTGMVAADFDKDGKVDLVAQIPTSNVNGMAVFFKGKGDGTFENPTVIGTGLPQIHNYVAADVNNDGNLDLIGIGGSAVWVQLGNGDGFQPPVPYDSGGSCGGFCDVKVADFDGDGNLDLAVAAGDAFAGFAVLRGKGDGTFESPVKFAVGATRTISLDIADVNGDGKPDVVIGHAGENGNNYTALINNGSAPAMAPLKNANGKDLTLRMHDERARAQSTAWGELSPGPGGPTGSWNGQGAGPLPIWHGRPVRAPGTGRAGDANRKEDRGGGSTPRSSPMRAG